MRSSTPDSLLWLAEAVDAVARVSEVVISCGGLRGW
jgi:hypothetical protein